MRHPPTLQLLKATLGTQRQFAAAHADRPEAGDLPFGGESLEHAARYLSIHPRTLNRRLQAEGSSYRTLLSRARSEATQQLLTVTRMDVTTIAHSLGYADSSGFSHAFRRWSGKAPIEWRALQDETRCATRKIGSGRRTARGSDVIPKQSLEHWHASNICVCSQPLLMLWNGSPPAHECQGRCAC
jgi:AraC-like DNA-binding protein